MILAILLTLAPPLALRSDSVRHEELSLELEGELLDHRFVDPDGDGRSSLCLALRRADGTRELRLHELGARGFDAAPNHIVPILEDILAYGFADVRDEAGQELVLLTRSGAYSYSLTKAGYRGNARRLVREELLYDVPDSRSLPYWAYVIPAEGGDRLLLPTRTAFGIWGPRNPAGHRSPDAADYARGAFFVSAAVSATEPERIPEPVRRDGGRRMTMTGSGNVRIESLDGGSVFLGDGGHSSTLLRDTKSYAAPALVDLDGDGDLDLVLRRESALHIHRSAGGDIADRPTRIEPFPEYLTGASEELHLQLIDLDRDGDRDLLARIEEDVDGFENAEMRLLLLLNDGRRLLPEAPDQVLRFEAAVLRTEVVDIDSDGNLDLVVRKFDLPSVLGAVTGLEFRLTTLLYFATGKPGRPLERKPALKQTQVFDENTVAEAVKNRRLKFDCDGDGIPDLVEVDLNGRIAIRRLRHESGFFSGDSWELEEHPWKRFETHGSPRSIEVLDVNGDGLADIVSPAARSLTLFLSSRTR